jgi:hypothetical protein
MNQTQSIIVYRNPGEQYLWESGIAGNFALIVLAIVIAVAATGALNAFVEKIVDMIACHKFDKRTERYTQHDKFLFKRKFLKPLESSLLFICVVQIFVYIYFLFF